MKALFARLVLELYRREDLYLHWVPSFDEGMRLDASSEAAEDSGTGSNSAFEGGERVSIRDCDLVEPDNEDWDLDAAMAGEGGKY